MLDSVFFLTGDLSSKLLMKGSIVAQRESRTSAGRSREEPRRLFPRTQGILRCSFKENEMVDKK